MEFPWTAPDGLVFPSERWQPSAEVRGVLIYLHGMNGAATDFHRLADAVADAGFVGFALNLRGQGNDPVAHRRGAELDLVQLEKDVHAFAEQAIAEYPGLPVFWCGESMGSLLLIHLLASPAFSLPVTGAIFSVPVVRLKKKTHPAVRWALRTASRVAPLWRLRPSRFITGRNEPPQITRDEAYRLKARSSSHFIGVFSLGFLNSIDDLMTSSRASARKIKIPSLVLSGGEDVFVHPEQIAEWFQILAARDKTLKLYPEAYHCLWNDYDRDLVIKDVLDWLRGRS